MIKLFPLLLLCGCSTVYDPQPKDTAFDESKRNWLEVFEKEIIIAIENNDPDAYHFFMQEYLHEKVRLWKEKGSLLDK